MSNNANSNVQSKIVYWKEYQGFNGSEDPDGFAECPISRASGPPISDTTHASAHTAVFVLCSFGLPCVNKADR